MHVIIIYLFIHRLDKDPLNFCSGHPLPIELLVCLLYVSVARNKSSYCVFCLSPSFVLLIALLLKFLADLVQICTMLLYHYLGESSLTSRRQLSSSICARKQHVWISGTDFCGLDMCPVT